MVVNCGKYAAKVHNVKRDLGSKMSPKTTLLVFAMLLDVVEAEGEDFEDDLKEDARPIIG